MAHMEIKEAIETIRKIEGDANQYELANLLGVAQSTISNYTKKNSYPTLRVAGIVYLKYGLFVEPFTEKAIKREAEYLEKYDNIKHGKTPAIPGLGG